MIATRRKAGLRDTIMPTQLTNQLGALLLIQCIIDMYHDFYLMNASHHNLLPAYSTGCTPINLMVAMTGTSRSVSTHRTTIK